MEILRRIFTSIWKTWFVAFFGIWFLLFFPFFYITLSRREWFRHTMKLQRVISWLILFCGGIVIRRIYQTDKNKLPQPCVYVANHSSYLDIIASYLVIPNYFVFMGKAELGKIPLFNIFFKEMHILVNRKSKMDSHKAFLRVGEEIERGNSVYIFPEGTISSEGKLKPFKNGAFKLAIDKQVPIVPIVYTRNWKLLQNGGFFKSFGNPGLSRAVVFPPISTEGMTEENLINLREQVHKLFSETLYHK